MLKYFLVNQCEYYDTIGIFVYNAHTYRSYIVHHFIILLANYTNNYLFDEWNEYNDSHNSFTAADFNVWFRFYIGTSG